MDNVLISGSKLVVNGTSYISPALGTMLAAFGVDGLAFVSPQVTPDPGGGPNLTVTGGLQLLGQDLKEAKLALAIDGGGQLSRFQLTGTLPSLSLGTLKGRQILPDTAGLIPALLGIAFDSVEVVFDSQGSQAYFAALESPATLSAFESLGFSLANLGFEFQRIYDANTLVLELCSTIRIGSTEIDARINVPIDAITPPGTWNLRVDSPVALSSALQDVVAFLDGTPAVKALGLGSFSSAFPDQVHGLPTLFVNTLSANIDVVKARLQFVSFTLGSARPIQFGDSLAIQKAGVTLYVDLLSSPPGFSVTLFGSVKLSDTLTLDLALVLPGNLRDNWILTANGSIQLPGFKAIAGLPMNTGHADLSLPDGFLALETLRLNIFEVDFNPAQGAVAEVILDLTVFATCELVHGLKLVNPRLALDIINPFNSAGQPAREVGGLISGTVQIGDLSFGLSAQKQADTWTFTCTTTDGTIEIGRLIAALLAQFHIDQIPDSIRGIVLNSLTLTFTDRAGTSTGQIPTSDLAFHCVGSLPVGDQEAAITLDLFVNKGSDGYTCRFDGTVVVGSRTFALDFSKAKEGPFLVARIENTVGEPIVLRGLVGDLSADVARYIPEGMEVDVKDVWFAYAGKASDKTFLFGLGLAAHLGLSELPLVGKLMAGQTAEIRDLQVLVASRAMTQEEVAGLSGILPAGAGQLPASGIAQGLTISARMAFGETTLPLALASAPAGVMPQAAPPAASPPANVTPTNGATWFTVQKSYGPVHFNRVGARFQDAVLTFLIDGSLTAAGLTLSLDGLGLGSPLSHFEPKFQLDGLGLQYANGPVEIGGSFIRYSVNDGTATHDEYDGAATIKTEALTLSAFGSYAYYNDHPSLFVYAVLDYPLGGPSFFFVTGLAAGFGYNRALHLPGVDQVANFPLVQAAVSPPPAPPTPPPGLPAGTGGVMAMLQRLEQTQAIPPEIGEFFFAVGIKFTSFKLVDSFLLLTVAFGNEFEIDLLGLATLVAPAPEVGKAVPALAEVQMAIKASFIPAQGFFGVAAQLTSASYVLSRDCHLTGGFAFSTWFSGPHSGDFVQTVGGYHPRFDRPSHYPVVPRLGLNWQVNSELAIKGDAYFALTSSLLMAGGALQVTWQSGSLKAWFIASADFLVGWKPFHYDATVSVDMGVSYTFHFFGTHHINVDIGADVHLWGPDFSGKAHIKLDVVSFDIKFGAGASQAPAAIPWDGGDASFTGSFLPADAVCGITIAGGLVRSFESISEDVKTKETIWIVSAEDLRLVTNALIPSKDARLGGATLPHGGGTDFGIAPMDVDRTGLEQSTHAIEILWRATPGDAWAPAESAFQGEPILKRVPAALWGESKTPSLGGRAFIDDALSGFTLSPAQPPQAGETTPIARDALRYSPETVANAFRWHPPPPAFSSSSPDEHARREALKASLVSGATSDARRALLGALDLDPGQVQLGPGLADVFVFPPQVKA